MAAPSYTGFYQSPAAPYQPAEAPKPRPQAFSSPEPQSYQNGNFGGSNGFSGPGYQSPSFNDASPNRYAEPGISPSPFDKSFSDPRFGNTSFNAPSFSEESFGGQSFMDASFPEPNFGSSFPEPTSFNGGNSPFSQLESGLDGVRNGYAAPQPPQAAPEPPRTNYAEPPHANYSEPPHGNYAEPPHANFVEPRPQHHDFALPPSHGSQPQSPIDQHRQLQAFDAVYDQPPQIALGATEARRPDFYEAERLDADFLDEDQVVPPPGARAKIMSKFGGRSAFMVGSALLGAIALGGALAFAYKQSGGGLSSDSPPIVQADNRPVKELPDDPGGKDFPHKNKLIYDRLTNGDEGETAKIVPRQEEIAVPALPPSAAPGGPAPVATTDMVTPQTTEATGAQAMASAEDDAEGGPRRVKTLVVRPDGSVMQPEVPAQTAEAAPAAAEDVETTAATPAAPAQMPVPAADPAPAPQQVAAAAAPAAAEKPAAPTKYVVQVGSKKNQTEALATFADMQQKYPTLLANYRPMVQKADLGAKGTWYRLRIGPIADKTAASKLCTQLKSQGLPDCLVMGQ